MRTAILIVQTGPSAACNSAKSRFRLLRQIARQDGIVQLIGIALTIRDSPLHKGRNESALIRVRLGFVEQHPRGPGDRVGLRAKLIRDRKP